MPTEQIIIYTYIVVVGLSFLFSLRSFKKNFPIHLKVFSLLLGLTLLVEIGAVTLPRRIPQLKGNSWLYNSFALIEFSAYAWFYKKIIQSKKVKAGIGIFQFLFPVFWFVTVFFVFGFTAWNSYVIVVGAFFTVCCVLAFYHQLLTSENVIPLSRNTEFWIATGMLILYLCQIPYFGMLNFLVKNYLVLARNIYPFLIILNTLMYAIFSYAYLCRINTKKF